MKTYSELSHLEGFENRFSYLRINGDVGAETFGRSRMLNQIFYKSPRWKSVRDQIILRDNGCDLGIPGMDIHSKALIHHINPITEEDILEDRECLYDPENLITVSFSTHNALHYGNDASAFSLIPRTRAPKDTRLW